VFGWKPKSPERVGAFNLEQMKTELMKRCIRLTIVIAASAGSLQACQKDEFNGPTTGGISETNQVVNLRNYEVLTMNVGALLAEVRSRRTGAIDIRVNGSTTRDLEVMVKPAEPDAELYVDDVQQPMPEIFTLTGFRRGTSEPCIITVADGWFSGVFKENGEEFFIQARGDFDPSASDDQFVIYRAQDVIDPGPTACGSDNLHTMAPDTHGHDEQSGRSTCKKVKMTVVADPQFRAPYSSNALCLAAMTAQINNASYCYWNNSTLLLDLTVSKNYIYTSSSSLTSTTASTLLDQFSAWGNASSARPSTINFLFTRKDLAGDTVGIAWTGVACYAPSYSYAVGEKMSTSVYWRNLIAHETGHLFDAPHHTSGIMQSMVTTSNTFSSSSKSTIQSFTNANNCYTTGTCN